MHWSIKNGTEDYISKLQILKNEMKMIKKSPQPTQLSRANSVRKPSDQVRKSKSRNKKGKIQRECKESFQISLAQKLWDLQLSWKKPTELRRLRDYLVRSRKIAF